MHLATQKLTTMNFSYTLSIVNNTIDVQEGTVHSLLWINRNERRAGAKMRPEIVSEIATGQLLANVSPEVFA